MKISLEYRTLITHKFSIDTDSLGINPTTKNLIECVNELRNEDPITLIGEGYHADIDSEYELTSWDIDE